VIIQLRLQRSGLKLLYIWLAILNKLFVSGFCRKPDEQEGAEEDGKTQDNCDGTGMGEGEGKKDVSDQITDEEQLLGTKDEMKDSQDKTKEQKKGEAEKPEEGLEMEQEFDGEMYDMPEGSDEEEAEGDKEKEELDREMGELDEQQDVVDEKLWNGSESDEEEEKEQQQKKDKYEKDAPVSGSKEESEMMAQQDNEESSKDDKPNPADKPEAHKDPASDEAGDEDDFQINEPEEQVRLLS
jgi:midasin